MVLIKYHNKYRAKISTFLYIVVLNMIRAECRKNKKHNKTVNLTNLNSLFYENKETLDFDDIKNILKNKKVFDIIEKKFKYGMRVADIAKEYKVSKTTIRTSIHSAIKKIRQKMV
jgi:DNA-directed RNA polymerase specialized sigma24 family protein